MGTDSRPLSRFDVLLRRVPAFARRSAVGTTALARRARRVGAAAVLVAALAAPAATTLPSAEKRELEREARLVIDLLQNYHYSDRAFRDLDAREVLARHLTALDPQGLFFTKEDVEFLLLRFGRSLKPVYLFKGDLSPAFEIHDLFLERARARLGWIEERLGRAFDFTADQTFDPKTEPAATAAEADRRWELHLKNAVLHEMLAGRTEADAAAEVKRGYARWRQSIASLDPLAVRERFFEGVINTFDPHSGYFSADTAKEFAVDMEGAVAGLGLDLKKDNGRCLVAAIQPGGPADAQNLLRPGDEIVAFAAEGAEWVETKGRRLREIVATVRGEPGAKLRVAYRAKGGGERQETTLTRARVVLAAERARGALFAVPAADGTTRRAGWIELPSFYTAGEKGEITSAARDVRELIEQMQARGATALVLDLRRNPGGALTEAAGLAGLFVPGGAVLLTRGLDGKVTVHDAPNDQALWHGPLVVLTSPRSASASEIFAAAMRFHRRAPVLGAATTFGKGTVQNYIDLAKLPAPGGANTASWGVLRLTSQRFYQPDGAAVQRTGAASDLVFADYGDPDDRTEAQLPHALPADAIPTPAGVAPVSGNFAAVDAARLAALRERLAAFEKTLPEFELRGRMRAAEKPPEKPEPDSLQLAKRRAEFARKETERHARLVEFRALSAREAWSVEPIDIAEVRAAKAAHQVRLKTVRADGTSPLHRIDRDAFLAGAPDGPWRELAVANFDFRPFLGDEVELATVFAAATGRAVKPEALRELLVRFTLLDEPDTAALVAAVRGSAAGAELDDAAATRALEALLRRCTELDPDLLRDHRALDVPLRTGLRLAVSETAAAAAKE